MKNNHILHWLIAIAISLIPIYSIWAQELSCGTIPPPYMDIADDNISKIASQSDEIINFKIQFHIGRKTNHTGGLDKNTIQEVLLDLNKAFAPANIRFNACEEIDYIDNDAYYVFHKPQESSLINHYNNPQAINVYYFREVYIDGTEDHPAAGYAHFPYDNINFVVIDSAYALLTTVHEMGHFFNLLHTHEPAYGIEYVDGSNCVTAGDLCCDTPADPGLSSKNVNSQCQYFGQERDPNGQAYHPDPTNLMSYAPKHCRSIFTSCQYNRIRNAANLANRRTLTMKTLDLVNTTIHQDQEIDSDIVILENTTINGANVSIQYCQEVIIDKNVDILTGENNTFEIKK